jgi:hypothetical protein
VCLEMTGPDVAREFVDAAAPRHPSLIDVTHEMDALFGVVNIPNVVWVDERGMIVRPAEPGWPPRPPRPPRPPGEERAARDPNRPARPPSFVDGGQDRNTYPDALRDWVEKGSASEFALSPAEVVARSQPRPIAVSQAAAEFELANHLWRAGRRDSAIAHFNTSHRLQPENWTYKRQAWSVVSAERVEGPMGLFAQGPTDDDTEPWPFDSDFRTDVARLGPGEYYPKTM